MIPRHSFRFLVLIIGILLLSGYLADSVTVPLDLTAGFAAPSLEHWFGTDMLGRDLFTRTWTGLVHSIQTGLLATFASGFLALLLAFISQASATGCRIIGILINMMLGIPHTILLILVTFTLGGGVGGIILAVALTHWPRLCRILQTELRQLSQCHWVQVSARLGKSGSWIIRYHLLPHLLPQLMVGVSLMIPHSILQISAMTFLGFGLSTEQSDIGTVLAESMLYLGTGFWWGILLPGLSLVLAVLVLDRLLSYLQTHYQPDNCRTGF